MSCISRRAVLAAAALWMEYYSPPYQAHHPQGGNHNLLNAAARELCSRIRFPAIPPHVLLNHHAASKLLGAFDEDRRWTMHAVRSWVGSQVERLAAQGGACI